MELVRLTVVVNEIEADQIQSLLKFENIESMQRPTDVGAGSIGGSGAMSGSREILVKQRGSRDRPGSHRRGLACELFVLRLERGGPWDWSCDMREQDGWDEHAKFMDDLVDEGFILLGGPLEGDRETMHIVERALRGGDSGAVRRPTRGG